MLVNMDNMLMDTEIDVTVVTCSKTKCAVSYTFIAT